jgi:hypothetical protein
VTTFLDAGRFGHAAVALVTDLNGDEKLDIVATAYVKTSTQPSYHPQRRPEAVFAG